MRIIAVLMSLFFIWSCYLQLNDVDPFVWISLYGVAVLVSILAAFNFTMNLVLAILAGSYLTYGAYLFPGFVEGFHANEVFRESLGLFICAIWFGILLYHDKKTQFKK